MQGGSAQHAHRRARPGWVLAAAEAADGPEDEPVSLARPMRARLHHGRVGPLRRGAGWGRGWSRWMSRWSLRRCLPLSMTWACTCSRAGTQMSAGIL